MHFIFFKLLFRKLFRKSCFRSHSLKSSKNICILDITFTAESKMVITKIKGLHEEIVGVQKVKAYEETIHL